LGAQDMVHVQSFLWICTRESRKRTGGLDARGQVELDVPPERVVADEVGGQGGVLHEADDGRWTGEEGEDGGGAEEGERVASYSLAELAAETGFEEATLARWVQAVERKGQAVFYGPPGTGKTMLAQGVARRLVGGGDGFYD